MDSKRTNLSGNLKLDSDTLVVVNNCEKYIGGQCVSIISCCQHFLDKHFTATPEKPWDDEKEEGEDNDRCEAREGQQRECPNRNEEKRKEDSQKGRQKGSPKAIDEATLKMLNGRALSMAPQRGASIRRTRR